ncbi:MAG: hypothetical protein L0Z62_11700 [Gemmataceae bacterium]|nr:hypothetical protein [Gemmataceae bacterium]
MVLDGSEVVQHESGPWFGRFVHPELGRLVEELASEPLPGVVVLTTRFPLPTLQHRRHAQIIHLSALDAPSAVALLSSLGVQGTAQELEAAAVSCGLHAKAVELLGTYLVRCHGGSAARHVILPPVPAEADASDEERHVARVLAAFQTGLPRETLDVLALATAFRQPPHEDRLLEYLASEPVRVVLHQTWGRSYPPFAERPAEWLAEQVNELVGLRLLERVGPPAVAWSGDQATTGNQATTGDQATTGVIDAHPLVRLGFEGALGPAGQRQSARARAGFLRGRPDRRPPATLEEAREEVELFHAYCDAGLWNEADSVYVALDNPKHRFLAPVFERELLLRFFPGGDWRRPPLWAGFGRWRSLAISFELAGEFEEALACYRESDAPLRGDALLALGRLDPLLEQDQGAYAPRSPWQTLWQAYRAHALCLAGRIDEAVALARALVPVDVYEWAHVFECLLRADRLEALDLSSVLYRPPHAAEHRWSALARQRMRADYLRRTLSPPPPELEQEYKPLVEAYDRGGLAHERCLARLSYARWLLAARRDSEAQSVNTVTLELARRLRMRVVEADAWELTADIALSSEDQTQAENARQEAARARREAGYLGPPRP